LIDDEPGKIVTFHDLQSTEIMAIDEASTGQLRCLNTGEARGKGILAPGVDYDLSLGAALTLRCSARSAIDHRPTQCQPQVASTTTAEPNT